MLSNYQTSNNSLMHCFLKTQYSTYPIYIRVRCGAEIVEFSKRFVFHFARYNMGALYANMSKKSPSLCVEHQKKFHNVSTSEISAPK